MTCGLQTIKFIFLNITIRYKNSYSMYLTIVLTIVVHAAFVLNTFDIMILNQ